MQKYHLHMIHVTGPILDVEGSQQGDINRAIEDAREAIRQQVSEDIRLNRQLTLWSIRVCDGNGNLLEEVFTSDTIADIVAVAFLDVPAIDGPPNFGN